MTSTSNILLGDCQELICTIPDHSIDLVFTDPPYIKKSIHFYNWLGEESKRVLKKDGWLITYTGTHYLEYVIQTLSRHMEYYWMVVSRSNSSNPRMWSKKVWNACKPILIYRQGHPDHDWFRDSLSFEKDKHYHKWGQSHEEARYIIEQFTKPGDTVLDPFSGGGTTAYACKQLERDCIAFEIDEKAWKKSVERLVLVQKVIAVNIDQLTLEV